MGKLFRNNWKMLILAAVALVAGIVIGIMIGLNMKEAVEETGALGTKSILPTTRILRSTYYTDCAHVTKQNLEPAAFVGYTQSEMEDFCRPDHVLKFDADEVQLIRTVDGCCQCHFVLRSLDGQTLTVLQTNPDTLTEQTVQTLDGALLSGLPEEELIKLAEGLVFDSLFEIDVYLESIGS